MPRIAIIGAGQSGLQLALGLIGAGSDVTLVSNRSADDIAAGRVLSSQCMFGSALQSERALGLDHWSGQAPPVEAISFLMVEAAENVRCEWSALLDWPAQSVDQRLKVPRWMRDFTASGGELLIRDAGVNDVEQYAKSHDLVVVATGSGALGSLFPRDAEKSPYAAPQRVLALTYVTGVEPRSKHSAISYNLIPGVGECFVFPALTTTGPCQILLFEGVPGGPMDCWSDVSSPEDHLARSMAILERFFPREAERCENAVLTDANGISRGQLTPTVRRPVGRLPSGAAVLGMADAVVLNDPITGQGANNAAKCADVYLASILESSDFDEAFMERTFDRYWRGYAQWVVSWTNAFLTPPRSHVRRLLRAAQDLPTLAGTIANGFDDPRVFYPWWFDAREADRLIAERRAHERQRFDPRELRRALGQFATGVAVVTTRDEDGHRVGVTANSFTSLSLEPPLVLWCLSKTASCLHAFQSASHFAVNVLCAHQHYLSRQFAMPAGDKFAGVDFQSGPNGIPVLDGVLAHFVCRSFREVEAGDHVIVIGEVEQFETFDGEPLVFHSGTYRIATRHPELELR